MGLEKTGLQLGKEIVAWTRASGKSLLATKPVKINTAGLKLSPQLERDTFVPQLSSKTFQTTESNIIQNATNLKGDEYLAIRKNTPKNGDFYQICTGTGGSDSPNYIINNYLRTGELSNSNYTEKEIKEIVQCTDKIFKKNRLSKDTVLYRKLNDSSFIPEAGKTYTDKGYTATSMNDRFPDYGYGGIDVEIIAPAGSECFIPGNQFYEVVLNRNSTFKVLEKFEDYVKLLLLNSI